METADMYRPRADHPQRSVSVCGLHQYLGGGCGIFSAALAVEKAAEGCD
ncbi:hypothetical protein [Blautia hydrogenotrophica]